ncbi:MAG: YARHG domain-containing protein [Lachnospiraceae bacterium]|nr:YARHG domain-containing protein [Lachnospiraceae bacterium]
MFCAGCGKELKEDAVFCDRCGRAVKDMSGALQVPAQRIQEKEAGSGQFAPGGNLNPDKREKTQKILIFVLLGMAVVIAVIALVIALKSRGAGEDNKELVPSETAVEGQQSQENEEALAAYEQFLKNERTLTIAEGFDQATSYNNNSLSQELPAREYYLADLLQQVQELNNEKFDQIQWTYLDLGDDGVKELALNLVQMDYDNQLTCIICYDEGNLKLCYDYSSGYRTYAQLCEYGYHVIGGPSGAAVHGDSVLVIDKKGERKELYDWTEYFGVHSCWYLEDDIEISQWAESQGIAQKLDSEIVVAEYVIGQDRYYTFYIYREETGDYELANAKEGEFFGNAAAEQFFRKCTELSEDFKNHGGVTQEEIDKLIQERQEKLGITERQLDQTEVTWSLLENPIYDVYRKNGAGGASQEGADASGDHAASGPEDGAVERMPVNTSDISEMVKALTWFEGPMSQTWKDSSKVCAEFLMFSIRDTSRILEHYPEAYMDDYWLCMPEATVKDYLKNSIGMENVARLETMAMSQGGYLSYSSGIYTLVHPDTGDYWIDEPLIEAVEEISDTEIEVRGQVRHGAVEDDSTTFFTLRMTENPQSVWGGYTLSQVVRWDTYILPYVDVAYLNKNNVEGWSEYQLRQARNEIYARHGRIFEDELLRRYFESCDWYSGTVPADQFDESVFNEVEEANRQFLIAYEEEMGYR